MPIPRWLPYSIIIGLDPENSQGGRILLITYSLSGQYPVNEAPGNILLSWGCLAHLSPRIQQVEHSKLEWWPWPEQQKVCSSLLSFSKTKVSQISSSVSQISADYATKHLSPITAEESQTSLGLYRRAQWLWQEIIPSLQNDKPESELDLTAPSNSQILKSLDHKCQVLSLV